MVQFNSNLNIPKTVGLTSSAQVGKIGETENKQPPKAEIRAVWEVGKEVPEGQTIMEGDLMLNTKTGKLSKLVYIDRNPDWAEWVDADWSEFNSKKEADRGHFH